MPTDANAERLKSALRENLKRRKAQSRGRSRVGDAAQTPPAAPDDLGDVPGEQPPRS